MPQNSSSTLKVYGDVNSGNCYKVKLLLHLLDFNYQWIPIDILNGDTETSEFRAINPLGKIPVLELSEGMYLNESNAILHFIAEETDWIPATSLEKARVLQWQFFEQYSHEPYIAVARFIQKYLGLPEDRRQQYEALHEKGYQALDVMEQQLSETVFLVGDQPTLADLSLFAYTHVAEEGGFELHRYPAINNWIHKIQSLEGYAPIG